MATHAAVIAATKPFWRERWSAALGDESPGRPQESEAQRGAPGDADRLTAYYKARERESWERYARAQRGER
jgi:hypothetical protein